MGRYLPEVDQMFDFRAERVIRSVDESLARLNLDYVDVIQVCGELYCQTDKKLTFVFYKTMFVRK